MVFLVPGTGPDFAFPIPGPELYKILHAIFDMYNKITVETDALFVVFFHLHLEVNI